MADLERRTRLRLAALNGVARALMTADTATGAVEDVLAAVGGGLEWTVAEYWVPDDDPGSLRREACWSDPLADVAAFVNAGEDLPLAPGRGLAGRVLESARAAWIRDVADDPYFVRQESARDAGLHGAFAVPVPLEGGLSAVLQLFTRERADEDPELLETIVAIGAHLGEFLLRRRAETALRQTEQRLSFQARLLDAVGEAVIATDLDGRIRYWNAHAEQLFGWKAHEVLGRDVADVTPTSIARDRGRTIMERLRKGESWSGEFMVRDRDGQEFPVLLTDSPIFGEDGGLIGVVGVSTDITDRKRAEEGQRFLAEAGRVLASSLDFGTTLRTVAALAVPTLGDWCIVQVPADSAGDDTVARAVPHDQIDAAQLFEAAAAAESGLLDTVLRNPVPFTGPSPEGPSLLRADRLARFGIRALLAVPLLGREQAIGMVTFAVTGSERDYDQADAGLAEELARRAALAIENARLYRRAEEGNRAKADFLAVVSHELRTPLNAIAGYADLLVSGVGGDLDEVHARQVDRIKVGARHLAHIIDEILAFARVEAGRTVVAVERTDVGEVVEEAAVVVEPDAREKGLAFSVEVPDEPLLAVTDPGKVRQIMVNLLSNAIKYTRQGGVAVAARARDGGVELQVRDTGIGIAPENTARIFEPFWQAEAPNTRTIGGTGLGLSVNQRLLNLLGGTIDVESEQGVGSTFTVWIPAARSPVDHDG